jgi:hypothetical protein
MNLFFKSSLCQAFHYSAEKVTNGNARGTDLYREGKNKTGAKCAKWHTQYPGLKKTLPAPVLTVHDL